MKIHYLLISSLLQAFQFLLLDISRWWNQNGSLWSSAPNFCLLAGLKETGNEETLSADATILWDGSCHRVSLLSLLQSLINITTLLQLSLCCSFQHRDLILPFICWIRSCLELDGYPQSVNYDWMLNLEVSDSVPSLLKRRYWSWVSKQALPASARILCAVAFQRSEYSVPAEMVPCFAGGNWEWLDESNMQLQLSSPGCSNPSAWPQAQDPGLELDHGFRSVVAIFSWLPSPVEQTLQQACPKVFGAVKKLA